MADYWDIVKNYDRLLYQTLGKIFSELCLTRGQMKELLCSRDHTDHNSIIKLVLEKEALLSTEILKDYNRNLSLLWIAVLMHYQDSAELLVRYGADVNQAMLPGDSDSERRRNTILHVLLKMPHPSPKNEQLVCLVTLLKKIS